MIAVIIDGSRSRVTLRKLRTERPRLMMKSRNRNDWVSQITLTSATAIVVVVMASCARM